MLGQTFTDFDVFVSDQTDEQESCPDSLEIQTVMKALRYHGHTMTVHRHLPRRGLAEQRRFLLD